VPQGKLYLEDANTVMYEPAKVNKRQPEIKTFRGERFLRTVCGPYVIITKIPPA
jgi:hypothetical protein